MLKSASVQGSELNLKIIFKIFLSILITILLALGITSCTTETQNSDYYNQNSQLTRDNGKLINELNKVNEELETLSKNQAKYLLEIASFQNNIKAYEIFSSRINELSISTQNDQLIKSYKDIAIHRIYELVKQADMIDGYRYFLSKYPYTSEGKEISRRMYEIFYKISEKKNTLSSYTAFLYDFQGAPEDLRDMALQKAIEMECQFFNSEYEKSISEIDNKYKEDPVIFRLFAKTTIDDFGKRLYQDAVKSRESNDDVTFMEKYNTVFECELFSDSDTRFELTMNKDLKNALKDIQHELKNIREDIAKSNSTILNKIGNISEEMNQQDLYVQEIEMILQEQNHLLTDINKPLNWDESESVWENYYRIGSESLKIVKSVKSILESPIIATPI